MPQSPAHEPSEPMTKGTADTPITRPDRPSRRFDGRILIIGFGLIGQGVLPLLLRHLDLRPRQIHVVTDTPDGADSARCQGIGFEVLPLTEQNHAAILRARLAPGDVVLNLSVNVSSVALLGVCQASGVLYLDTCIEPWGGAYLDPTRPLGARTNQALRETALALRRAHPAGPTALLTHGANPGLVSHFVKRALLHLAHEAGLAQRMPACRAEWADLARSLDIRVIHIAERDTQSTGRRKQPDEFVNTWSIEGLMSEARQPAELGWGTHERRFPTDGARQATGSQAAIYLQRPEAATRLRTWTPLAGPDIGFLITHSEAISIADYLTVGDDAEPVYRPTVAYAYHPCDDAVLSLDELAARGWRAQSAKRLLRDDISEGTDALGVLLMGPRHGAYWYGSLQDIDTARRLCPRNNATSLQVTAAITSGLRWAIDNPDRGILEPDELPHEDILSLAEPYLGRLVGVHTPWTPLTDRGWLMDETLDHDDPWQFDNFRVS